MSKVIFINKHLLENLARQVGQLTKDWEPGSRVAIKAHLGEYGNLYHVRPQIVGLVVEELKNNGLKPFVYDTVVIYPGSRDTKEKYLDTARRHGFTEQTLGCPVIISDDIYWVKTSKLDVGVADILKDIKYHLIISHATGHMSAGFGGAIKNLGMGCVGAETKKLLHEKTKAKLVGVCVKCGACVKICPKQAISLGLPRTKTLNSNSFPSDESSINDLGESKDNFLVRGWRVDYLKCWGCGYCLEVCKEHALAPVADSLNHFLAEAALPVVKNRANLFINIAMSISSRCDCASHPEAPVCPDIGFFISKDPVAVDLATIDAIKKIMPDFFKKIDPKTQIQAAEKLGLGETNYVVEEFFML